MTRYTFFISIMTVSLLHASQSAELYATKCAKCHGEHGERKALGSSRVIGGWDRSAIEEALRGYKENRRNQTGRGTIMRGLASELSDAEIESLAHYIATMK